MGWIKMGEFEVASKRVMISDPCYESGQSLTALNGTYDAYIFKNKEGRVMKLKAVRKGSKVVGGMQEARIAGVDSGQMSITDYLQYRESNPNDLRLVTSLWQDTLKDPDGGQFYAVCCSLTCGDDNGQTQQGGVFASGCVSQSGYGDGGYPIFYGEDENGDSVAFEVRFK
jgi:hypothetical protein